MVKRYRPALVIGGAGTNSRHGSALTEMSCRSVRSSGSGSRRPPSTSDYLPGQTLPHRPDVVNRGNAFPASHKGPDLFSISVKHLVCHNDQVPCNDNLPDGKSARPDGVHYSSTAMQRFAPKIFNEIWHTAGLQAGRKR